MKRNIISYIYLRIVTCDWNEEDFMLSDKIEELMSDCNKTLNQSHTSPTVEWIRFFSRSTAIQASNNMSPTLNTLKTSPSKMFVVSTHQEYLQFTTTFYRRMKVNDIISWQRIPPGNELPSNMMTPNKSIVVYCGPPTWNTLFQTASKTYEKNKHAKGTVHFVSW